MRLQGLTMTDNSLIETICVLKRIKILLLVKFVHVRCRPERVLHRFDTQRVRVSIPGVNKLGIAWEKASSTSRYTDINLLLFRC